MHLHVPDGFLDALAVTAKRGRSATMARGELGVTTLFCAQADQRPRKTKQLQSYCYPFLWLTLPGFAGAALPFVPPLS